MSEFNVSGIGAKKPKPIHLNSFGKKEINPDRQSHLPGSPYLKTVLQVLLEIREEEVSSAHLEKQNIFRTGQNSKDFEKTIKEIRKNLKKNRKELERFLGLGLDSENGKKDPQKAEAEKLLKELNNALDKLQFSAGKILKKIKQKSYSPNAEKFNPKVAAKMLKANKNLANNPFNTISPERTQKLLA